MTRGFPLHSNEGPSPTPSDQWSARRHATWERRLAELLEFRRQQNHVNVPRNWAENPRLATWVANQRRLIGAGAMSDERLLRLRQSKVSWEGMDARRGLQQAAWDRMFAALRTFHRSHGHVNVPRRWTCEPRLAAWLSTQRFLARTGALRPERESRLDSLAPDWRLVRIRHLDRTGG
jgi:hypothetical protein